MTDYKSLSNDELDQMIRRASSEKRTRRNETDIKLEDIKAGMSPADVQRAREKISRVLRGEE